MGKTLRKEPSNRAYMKQPSHINRKRLEETVEGFLTEYPIQKKNRISSAQSRIITNWDDKPISEYRGQKWYRE